MSGIVRPSQSQQEVVAQDQATLDRALQRSIIRRTSVAGLIGLVYGLCAGIILAAYHDFGSLSLLEPSRLMVADPTQVKPLPKESMLEDAAVAHELATQLAPAAARRHRSRRLANRPHPPGNGALVRSRAYGGVDMPPATEGRDSTRDTASPDPSGYELRAEERPGRHRSQRIQERQWPCQNRHSSRSTPSRPWWPKRRSRPRSGRVKHRAVPSAAAGRQGRR